jgi:hypothetical protein
MLCSYGCGQKAITIFNNGKGCCSGSANKCQGKRRKDSILKKGIKLGNTNRPNPRKGKPGKPSPFKGKKIEELYDEETVKRLRESSVKMGKLNGGCCADPIKEKERRKRVSETMKTNGKSGGYRRGSGRGKGGWYKGIWCDSSWELAFVVFNLDKGISIKRNEARYPYVFDGKTLNFLPDFIVNETDLVEVKGYMTEQNRQKIVQCTEQLTVIEKDDIVPYIDYAITNYGKDFVNTLYGRGTARGAA